MDLFPYILSRLPQLLMCGCSCCKSLAAASCLPSFLFLQITATSRSSCCKAPLLLDLQL